VLASSPAGGVTTIALPRAAIARLGRVYVIRAVKGPIAVRSPDPIDGVPTGLNVEAGQAVFVLSDGQRDWFTISKA